MNDGIGEEATRVVAVECHLPMTLPIESADSIGAPLRPFSSDWPSIHPAETIPLELTSFQPTASVGRARLERGPTIQQRQQQQQQQQPTNQRNESRQRPNATSRTVRSLRSAAVAACPGKTRYNSVTHFSGTNRDHAPPLSERVPKLESVATTRGKKKDALVYGRTVWLARKRTEWEHVV